MASPPDPLAHARLIVDLDALAANFHTLQAMAGGAEVAPVVKAQGYGMGAETVALRLWAEGARRFFVARVAAGEALRAALGPSRPAAIYVFDGCEDGAAPRLAAADLIPALAGLDDVARWQAQAKGGARLKAALHADTGLNRLGLSFADCERLARSPTLIENLELDLVMSHLACGAEPKHPLNARQLAAFRDVAALFPNTRTSLSASGGILLGDDYSFDLVRPGVALYGGGPRDVPDARFKTVAAMQARILAVRDLQPGESVGYGAGWMAERPTTLAIIGAGYADALLRSNFPNGAVWFDGALRPFAGRLSMDLAAIDVTGSGAKPGDWVELFGHSLAVEVAAAAAGTLCYELLTGLGARTPREYRGAR
ncbi:MAG TPA: alanine racemase [Caulobacteraceae bacterium]|jgi:alanine racemase|nr:alanine racemase [Caulobacteraceae bacterium]